MQDFMGEGGPPSGSEESSRFDPGSFYDEYVRHLWAELYGTPHSVDPYRAGLQRVHLELMAARLHHSPVVRAYARGELSVLDEDIRDVLASTRLDRPTRFHLEDARRKITRSLDPTLPPPAPKPAPKAPSFPLRIHSRFCDSG